MIKKVFLFILILLSSCGYQPLYKKFQDYEFNKIKLEGNQDINLKIIRILDINEKKIDNKLNDLLIKTNSFIEETSKNKKGQVESYRSNLVVEISIIKNNKVLSNQVFNESFSYNNKDSRFDLLEYQKEVEEIMLNQIIKKIIFFLNLR